MNDDTLDAFIADSERIARESPAPADCVPAITPLMRRPLLNDRGFLKPQHFRPNPGHYARNAVYIADDGDLSLFALVWEPGQWAPDHDHGAWGAVGVARGVLAERRLSATIGARNKAACGLCPRPGRRARLRVL